MRIAVLEDDAQQRGHVVSALSQRLALPEEHIAVVPFDRGELLRKAIRSETFDLLVLDWSMPDLDGIDLLRWLRGFQKDSTPVLMLSMHGSDRQIATALDEGADDYVVKPFRTLELCARIRRLLKHHGDVKQAATSHHAAIRERYGAWLFDRGQLVVEVDSPEGGKTRCEVSDREFRMALALFRHLGQPVSRSYLLEQGSPRDEALSTRALDSHIYRLRSKLRLQPENGVRLQTVYGRGYRLERVQPIDTAAGF